MSDTEPTTKPTDRTSELIDELRDRVQSLEDQLGSLIPYRPANQYRTLRQKMPCRPANSPFLLEPTPPVFETFISKSPAKTRVFESVGARKSIPYCPARNTVLPGKEYRTARQGIPYCPARNTVPPSKGYRTTQQNITYSPTKVMRNVPAKRGKPLGRRFVRHVFVSC